MSTIIQCGSPKGCVLRCLRSYMNVILYGYPYYSVIALYYFFLFLCRMDVFSPLPTHVLYTFATQRLITFIMLLQCAGSVGRFPLLFKILGFFPLMTLFLLDFCTGLMVHAFYAFFHFRSKCGRRIFITVGHSVSQLYIIHYRKSVNYYLIELCFSAVQFLAFYVGHVQAQHKIHDYTVSNSVSRTYYNIISVQIHVYLVYTTMACGQASYR